MLKCKIKLKNSLSVILSVLIVISAALCVPVTASAATYDSNPDNFEFSYNSSDMTASVTKYKGDSEYVEIPFMVNGYKVDIIGNIFRDNYKLKGVIIPDTVDYVSRGIFSGCVSLTDVDLGKGITKISSGMFYNCKSLESLTIPEQIEEFEYIPYIDGDYYRHPFDGCTSLKNLYLKAKDISSISYLNLPSLTNIVIASTVDSLPNDAFSGYNYIENVTFENGLMVLPDSCFKNCTSLKNITLPDSMMSVGKSAFENCFNLKSVTFSKNLNTISPSAFKGCSSIESLNFNDNLREIDSNAFKNCTSVKNVTFNNSLNTIGESAFNNCTSIEKAELSSSVSSLGENSFAGCTGLKNVTLSEKLKYISSGAFSGCSSLESIDLPDNITKIESSSFLDCTALQNVKIGKNTTSIENYAFSGCSSLKNIEIPANVKYIWWAAFEDCTNLSSVKLNNGLQQLDNYVFYNCLNLKKIIIPASVTYLSDYSLGYYGKNDNNYKIPDFIIVGDINSCAQRYANNNGFKFEEYKVNLSTPQITSLKNTTGGVKLQWNKVNGAYGYRLYYRPASGGWKRFKDTTATSYTDSSVVPNKTETYTIRCLDKDGNTISGFYSKGWSKKYTATTPKITKLTNTSKGVSVTWNKIAGVYGYRLYRKTSSGWKKIKDTTATTYTDSAVKSGRTETYTIRCIDRNGKTVSGYNSKGWSKKYVYNQPKSIKLNKTSAYIGKKESVTLKYTLSAGSTSTVTWSSSNKNVATVSGGKVTAKGAGATTITATTANGKKATCKVTVINGVRTYYTCTSGNRTVAEYSVVVPDGCYDKKSSGGWRCYYEKYNYDKYDMGYVGAILFTESPYSQLSPPAPNFTKLGEKNGYVFGYTKATGLEFIADDITSAKKYSTACQNFNYVVKTFRFE